MKSKAQLLQLRDDLAIRVPSQTAHQAATIRGKSNASPGSASDAALWSSSTSFRATSRAISNASTIVWHGDFTAEPGKDKDVETALTNIYESGLAALKAKFAK